MFRNVSSNWVDGNKRWDLVGDIQSKNINFNINFIKFRCSNFVLVPFRVNLKVGEFHRLLTSTICILLNDGKIRQFSITNNKKYFLKYMYIMHRIVYRTSKHPFFKSLSHKLSIDIQLVIDSNKKPFCFSYFKKGSLFRQNPAIKNAHYLLF